MATKIKIPFTIKRFIDFLKIFARNKRGMLGLLILFGFIIMAAGAPLLTPYDALGRDKANPEIAVAGKYAAPALLRFLPPVLGGMPTLTENMFINGTLDYNASSGHPSVAILESSVGDPLTNGTGSIAVRFRREEDETPYGEVRAYLIKEFDFPYGGGPERFLGDISLLPTGTTYKKQEKFFNETSNRVEFRLGNYLKVPIVVNVFIGQAGGETWNIFPYYRPGFYWPPSGFLTDWTTEKASIQKPSRKWIYPRYGESTVTLINSGYGALCGDEGVFKGKNPVKVIFTETPGRYVWGIEIIFEDNEYANETVETTLNIDNFNLKLQGTGWGVLGTDQYGRDLFAQLVYGSRISLYVGLLTAILGVTLGLTVGLAAGYLGKLVDEILMRFADMLLVLPGLPLLIVLVYVLGAKIENLILILGFLGWMGFSRLVRSQVLSIRERAFVEAAKAVGAGKTHIITRHVLPNVMSLVYVNLATSVPGAIVAEASVAWLGFSDPNRMSWGRMLYENNYCQAITNWWWVVPPGLCIAALAVAFILLGFSLDEILNPRLRRRR